MKLIIGMVQTGILSLAHWQMLTQCPLVVCGPHWETWCGFIGAPGIHGETRLYSKRFPDTFSAPISNKASNQRMCWCCDIQIQLIKLHTLYNNDFFSPFRSLSYFFFSTVFFYSFLHSTAHSILHLIFNTCRRFSPSVPFSLPTLQTIKWQKQVLSLIKLISRRVKRSSYLGVTAACSNLWQHTERIPLKPF